MAKLAQCHQGVFSTGPSNYQVYRTSHDHHSSQVASIPASYSSSPASGPSLDMPLSINDENQALNFDFNLPIPGADQLQLPLGGNGGFSG
jgi:hypothetical protein